MTGTKPIIGWDTSTLLKWLEPRKEKTGDIVLSHDEILAINNIILQAERNELTIILSVVWQIEILLSKRTFEETERLQLALKSPSFQTLSVDTKIAKIAHDIRDMADQEGRKIKTADAIHMATAIHHDVAQFHTFDEKLIGLSQKPTVFNLEICKPKI